jgi:hypothetical protein
MEEIAILISTVGFPIVMCIWFMVRTEKVIKQNTEVLTKLLGKTLRSSNGVGIYKTIKEKENYE